MEFKGYVVIVRGFKMAEFVVRKILDFNFRKLFQAANFSQLKPKTYSSKAGS